MKLRKRYILLILLAILPFYKLIHLDDYCFGDVDLVIIGGFSVLFAIAFIGVVIIKGFGVDVNTIGLSLIFCSAITLGLIFVIIRKMGSKENPLVIINYFMLMAFIFGGFMSINNWKTPDLTEWILLLSLGVFGYVGQLYMTKAFQSQETSIIAPLKYLEVVFMIIIGATWFGEIYNLWTLLGIFLILLGLFYNIYLKKKQG